MIPTPKTEVGKNQKKQSGTYTMKHIVSRMCSYFLNRWPLSYLNLTKNMKTYTRRQQHKKLKHQDIKQKEPPLKYRLGTISNIKLLAGLNRFYRNLTRFYRYLVLSDFYTIFFSLCFIIIWLSFLFQTEAFVSSLKTSRMLPRQVNIFGRFLVKRIPSSQTC